MFQPNKSTPRNVSVPADVLSIVVLLQGSYPSVNTLGNDGARAGRKTDEYKALFRDVVAAAEAEIQRTGWATAECECFCMIVRYVNDQRPRDAGNLGKCEEDGLTKAGVWVDDQLANPPLRWIRFDPEGPPRIAITVTKLHEPRVLRVSERAHRVRRRRPVVASAPAWRAGDPIPVGYALVGNDLVPIAKAMAFIGR